MAKGSVTVKNHKAARYSSEWWISSSNLYGKSLFCIWPSTVKYLVSLHQGKQIKAFTYTAETAIKRFWRYTTMYMHKVKKEGEKKKFFTLNHYTSLISAVPSCWWYLWTIHHYDTGIAMHIKIDIVDWTILKATAGNVDLLIVSKQTSSWYIGQSWALFNSRYNLFSLE